MFKELNILKLFFESPTREFNVREVARLAKTAPATASKKLKEFSKESILKQRKERMLVLYRADLESSSYKDLKIYYSIRKLRESKLIERLTDFYLKPAIILFGSCSKGIDTETSDIDVMVISENTKEFPKKDEFEKKLNRPLQIFTAKNLKELANSHLISNILNGVVLEGEFIWN